MLHELVTILIFMAASGALNLLLSRKSQIDAWCNRRPYLAASLKLLRGAGFDPWAIVQAATLATKKRLPLAMQVEKAAGNDGSSTGT